MEMHMVMAIDMIEWQSRILERLKLGTNLVLQLLPRPLSDKEVDPRPEEIR
jgi:hypothetical protein